MDIKCFYCGDNAIEAEGEPEISHVINCPNCGRYKFKSLYERFGSSHRNEVATYLFYNGVHVPESDIESLYGSKKQYILLDNNLSEENNENEWFERVSLDQIVAFNKLTFSEKIAKFILMLSERSDYYNKTLVFSIEQLYSALFIPRFDFNNQMIIKKNMVSQLEFVLAYIKKRDYIHFQSTETQIYVKLQACGWDFVDKLQRNSKESSKNVFIAMSFADDMKEIRESIRAAVSECGYNAILMDELQHNHQIVPEMLYEIRQAKFVVAELTGHNNGAYYEAGYALGVGKEVIQLCKQDTFGKDGHFDVKQVNTILWEDSDDLKVKLIKRIKATIE